MTSDINEFDEDFSEEKSKTQLKKEMHALQALGESLIALSVAKRATLNLSEKLEAALQEAPRIKQNNARKRHLQFIGKLMRDIDTEKLEADMNALREQGHRSSRQNPAITLWCERLLNDNNALNDFITNFPQCDIQHLRQVLRQALKNNEKAKAAAPDAKPAIDKKLFKLVQEILAG